MDQGPRRGSGDPACPIRPIRRPQPSPRFSRELLPGLRAPVRRDFRFAVERTEDDIEIGREDLQRGHDP